MAKASHLNVKVSSYFFYHLTYFGFILFMGYLFFDLNMFQILIENDRSKLSFVILMLLIFGFLISLFVASKLFFIEKSKVLKSVFSNETLSKKHFEEQLTRVLDAGAFVVDTLLKLGLVGTIVGFLLMLMPLSKVTTLNISTLQSVLGNVLSGMYVALYTTLLGLSSNILLRFSFLLLSFQMQKVIENFSKLKQDEKIKIS